MKITFIDMLKNLLEVDNMKNVIGTKYQMYENDEFKIYRIIAQTDSHHYLMVEKDGTHKTVRDQELLDKYIRLIPDAFMNILATDKEEYPDVYVCVNKASSLEANIFTPDLILRQSLLYSDPTNLTFNTTTVTFGMCLTTQTSSNIQEYMEFKNIEYKESMALYIDDTLDDIFKVLNQSKSISKINDFLKMIKDKYGNNTKTITVLGYTDNLQSLMEENEFIPRFRELFNITSLNFPIILGDQSYDKDKNIILNMKQIGMLSAILGIDISPIAVIKYDKDIDVSKIVSYKHIIVSDSEFNMYLIAYKEIPKYNILEHNDILNAMTKNI